MLQATICVFLLHSFLCVAVSQPLISYEDVVVDTGLVRGFAADDGEYFAFLGIPYASPPIGEDRFKAPKPPEPWKDIFIANHTVKCPFNGTGDEDCLILNVFIPKEVLDYPLPVLFYIHGGSFLMGSGQTKGVEPLIKENVIVVTINYRLGALGFLCLRTEQAPGNAGLKDQVAALKWVKRNIDKFGGSPDDVTIYGMSAGGASVEMLIASEMASDLFHKAVIESGTASAVWAIDTKPIETAETLLHFLNIQESPNSFNYLYEYYQNTSSIELSIANSELYENFTDGTFGFVPCLERKLDGEQFLTNTCNFLSNGKYNKVPMMFIFAETEGLFLRSLDYYELNYKDRMNYNFKDFLPADLIFDSDEIKNEITEKVKQFYFGREPIGATTLQGYFDYFGDYLVSHGLLNSALAHSQNGDTVYMLEFAYKGQLGSLEKFFDNVNSAGHGDAIKHVILEKSIDNEDDRLAVKRMAKIIADFARHGDPNPSPSPLIPAQWPPIYPDNIIYLRLDRNLQILENPISKRKIFWDELYDLYRRPLSSVDSDLL